MAAREAAKSAATLEQLRTMLDRFQGCALRTTATQLVFADGNPQARVMFVGEAPGRDEYIEGLATDPRPSGSRKLAGREAYRVLQGDFRVVYTVDDKSRKIVVLAAVHRRDAYR